MVLEKFTETGRNNMCISASQNFQIKKSCTKNLAKSFKKANTVILCPIYSAGENIKLGFSYNGFAKKIIKNSKVKLFIQIEDK